MTFRSKILILTFTLLISAFNYSPSHAKNGTQTVERTDSPLQIQADALISSPSGVGYEFVNQVFPNFSMSEAAWRRLPVQNQNAVILQGYYLSAVERAMLLIRGEQDLADILDKLNSDASNSEAVAKEFEQTYNSKFGSWPPMVPVDVDALIGRMLDQRTIR